MPINPRMNASAWVLARDAGYTRRALASWRQDPWPILRTWLAASVVATFVLLTGVWLIALLLPTQGEPIFRPPLVVGGPGDVIDIFGHNVLVLALHAMACVAGFIAGSSMSVDARNDRFVMRPVNERAGRIAVMFVACATLYSLSLQAYSVGTSAARIASAVHTSVSYLLIGSLPHGILELVALFLPLAAWVIAARRGERNQLLAAAIVTVALALPALAVAALSEVYVAPHLVRMMVFGHP